MPNRVFNRRGGNAPVARRQRVRRDQVQSRNRRSRGPSDLVPPPLGVGRIFRVTRNWQQASGSLTAGTTQLGVISLGISSFSSAFDNFLTVWDMARFDFVDVTFTPSWGPSPSAGSVPMIAVVPNYDDSSPPPTLDFVAGAGNSTLRLFDRPLRRRVSAPMLLTPAIAGGSAATNALITMGQWFNPSIVTITNMFVPLVKYAIMGVAVLPGSGLYYLNFKIHLSLAQPVMG